MPRVSVVIPTYNRSQLVCEALDSVFKQTYTNFEVIVVDDGSTDDTARVLARYNDPRLCIVHQKNKGQGSARNAGIRAAKGDFIAFLDSDDLWEPIKLKAQLDLFNRYEDLIWAYSDAYAFYNETKQKQYLFSQHSRQYEGDIASNLFMLDFIGTSTVMAKRCVFDEVGKFTHLPKAQDWEMWLRIASKYKVRKSPHALTGYRIHKHMITQSQNVLFKHQCHVSVLERAVAYAPEIYEPLYRRGLSNQFYATGLRLMAEGNLHQSRLMFLQSIRYLPYRISSYLFCSATLLGNRIFQKLIKIYKKHRS